MKKLLALLFALVMVLSLCSCGGSGKDDDDEDQENSGTSSYSDAVKTRMAVAYEGNTNKLKDLAPREYWDYLEQENERTLQDIRSDYQDSWEEMDEEFKSEYGDDYRVTYEISDKEALEEEQLTAVGKALTEKYGIDADKVTKGYQLSVDATISGYEGEDEAEMEMTAIEYNGAWYIIDYYDYGDGDVYADFSTPT